MRRYGAWVAVLLLACYLVFVGGGWSGLYESGLRTASVALAAVALLAWMVVAWRSPAWRPHSVLLPAIAVALGSLAISTVFSRHVRQSVEYLGYAILLAALYLLLVRLLRDRFFRTRIGALSVMLAVVVGSAYAIANVAHWISWWQVIGRMAVPPLRPESESLVYGNPSAVLTLVLLLACSAFAVVGTAATGRRILVALVLVLAAFATLVSGSRSGWLAIGATIVVMVLLLGADGGRRRQLRAVIATWTGNARGRVLLAVAGIGGFGILVILAPVIVRRLTDGGADLRLSYIASAGRMFGEAPLQGTGPGTWVVQRIAYTPATATDYYIPHAHNIYAQTAAELGIVGIIAGLVLAVSLAILVRDALRDDDPVRRRWAWAAAFALVYFGAHQLLDFYANMTAILFAAALPVAWLDATTSSPVAVVGRALPQRLNRAGSFAGVALVVLAGTGLLLSESVAQLQEGAVDYANVGDWPDADREAQLAVAADPAWSPYQLTMGLTAAYVGDHPRAADAFRRVAEADDLPEAWLDLAAEELLLGNEDAARVALERAARLGLQRPALAMGIGELAERLGNTTLSDRAYVTAIASVPSLAGDPWWTSEPSRAARFREVVNAAIEAAGPANAWQIALMTGDADFARGLLVGDAAATASLESLVIDAWTGNEAAFQRILAICDAHPLDGAALGWAARLYARHGDDDSANLYRRWAFTASSVAVPTGAELRVSEGPKIGRTVAGSVAEFWGTYTYRRPTPWNILVPSLIQLELQ